MMRSVATAVAVAVELRSVATAAAVDPSTQTSREEWRRQQLDLLAS